jgi:hypothetical protein
MGAAPSVLVLSFCTYTYSYMHCHITSLSSLLSSDLVVAVSTGQVGWGGVEKGSMVILIFDCFDLFDQLCYVIHYICLPTQHCNVIHLLFRYLARNDRPAVCLLARLGEGIRASSRL